MLIWKLEPPTALEIIKKSWARGILVLLSVFDFISAWFVSSSSVDLNKSTSFRHRILSSFFIS